MNAGMPTESLVALDSLTVEVLSDNVSDTYVTKTPFAHDELANVVAAGAELISGQNLLVANLGYGLRLTSRVGSVEHVVLFDTGTEGTVFLRNCANLGIGFGDIEDIAITHGHWDHMGALTDAIDAIVAARGTVTVHVNPLMFRERAVRLRTGQVVPTQRVPTPDEIGAHGASVVNEADERFISDGHFYYSGEIPRLTPFETGRSDHLCRAADDASWEPDPLLMDERMLVAHVRGLGLVVFSACSHAGIVNVCTEAARRFPNIPMHAVMGGLHLGGVMERLIDQTVEGLAPFGFRHLIAGHCTGWRAVHALANAYGDRVSQSAVGTSYRFQAE